MTDRHYTTCSQKVGRIIQSLQEDKLRIEDMLDMNSADA
jgi:hypothetical protein